MIIAVMRGRETLGVRGVRRRPQTRGMSDTMRDQHGGSLCTMPVRDEAGHCGRDKIQN